MAWACRTGPAGQKTIGPEGAVLPAKGATLGNKKRHSSCSSALTGPFYQPTVQPQENHFDSLQRALGRLGTTDIPIPHINNFINAGHRNQGHKRIKG
ncbi:MAG: hypothetical protein NTV50_00525 [Planctomycetota bacterium]|nr:hypothetical protein [Planctomycetota bacterium]